MRRKTREQKRLLQAGGFTPIFWTILNVEHVGELTFITMVNRITGYIKYFAV